MNLTNSNRLPNRHFTGRKGRGLRPGNKKELKKRFSDNKKRTELLNKYKDFIDQQHYAEKFDS
jgi:uncharacterized protein YeeX (DUF496 family)